MHIAIGTGIGFQNKIKDKISFFEGHIRVSTYENNSTNTTLESIDPQMIRSAAETERISFVNSVAYASTVFKTDKNFAGGLLKGIDSTYRWNAFEDYLIDGRLPDIGSLISREILLSKSQKSSHHKQNVITGTREASAIFINNLADKTFSQH